MRRHCATAFLFCAASVVALRTPWDVYVLESAHVSRKVLDAASQVVVDQWHHAIAVTTDTARSTLNEQPLSTKEPHMGKLDQTVLWVVKTCSEAPATYYLEAYAKHHVACLAADYIFGHDQFCSCAPNSANCTADNTGRPSLRNMSFLAVRSSSHKSVPDHTAGWLCSKRDLHLLAYKLYSQELEKLVYERVPHVVEDWAFKNMQSLSQSSKVAINQQVATLSQTEVDQLGALVLQARVAKVGEMALLLNKQLNASRETVTTMVAGDLRVSSLCVHAQRECIMDSECLSFSKNISVVEQMLPMQIVNTAGSCSSTESLLVTLGFLIECRVLSDKATVQVSRQYETLKDARDKPCTESPQFAEGLSKALLPDLATWPAEDNPLGDQCRVVQRECMSDGKCASAVSSISSKKADEVMATIAGLCVDKTSMLRAVKVMTECPGMPAVTATSRARQDLENSEEPFLCTFFASISSPASASVQIPASSNCDLALSNCTGDSLCKPRLVAMQGFGASTAEKLADVSKLCGKKESLLAILAVVAACPGLLPQKEMQESHDALALVHEDQLCKKTHELIEVLNVLLTPPPSMQCLSAQQACSHNAGCREVQSATSTGSAGFSQSLMTMSKLCHKRRALVLSMRVITECNALGANGNADRLISVIKSTPGSQLCEEVHALVPTLTQQPAGPLKVPRQVASSSCSEARKRCAATTRCGLSDALSTTNGSAQALAGVFQMCDDRDSLLAGLQVIAECPGNELCDVAQSALVKVKAIPQSGSCLAVFRALHTGPVNSSTGQEEASAPEGVLQNSSHPTASIFAAEIAKASHHELPHFVQGMVQSIFTAFDTLPTDGSLNAVELQAFLLEADENENLLGPGVTYDLNITQMDASRDKLVSQDEFAAVLKQRLAHSLY